MSFREFQEQVTDWAKGAIKEKNLPSFSFSPSEPPRPDMGDLSLTMCFQLAKMTGSAPMDLAQLIAGVSLNDYDLIESVEVIPPGYINLRIKRAELTHRSIHAAISDDSFGKVELGEGRRVLVEHTSVNPNKALHVGHLRNLFVGDVLYRILKFMGYDVKVLNYIDDSGLQVADLIIGFKHCDFGLEPPDKMKFDQYCGDQVYTQVTARYEQDPDLMLKRTQVLTELEDETTETAGFRREVVDRVLADQLETSWRAGGSYHLLNYESHILSYKLWDQLFEIMKEKEIVEMAKRGKLKGCWVVKVEDAKGDDKVLVRSDGTATYIAKDLSYAAWKVGILEDPFSYGSRSKQPNGETLWATTLTSNAKDQPKFTPSDFCVTVIDARQARLQKIISSILSKLYPSDNQSKYLHLAYEVVSLDKETASELGFEQEGKSVVQMSGRKGLYVNADQVMNAIWKKSYDETKKRNPSDSEDWLKKIAGAVSLGALRFSLLKQDLQKMIVFSMKESLNLEGETGPYVQYARARARRILEKSGEKPKIDLTSAASLNSTQEFALVSAISKFDLILEETTQNMSPNTVARYCFDIANTFNIFYEKIPVLKEEDEATRLARLALVAAFSAVVERCLHLLGIESPDRI
ncbi:MAG: arginine--tRNA ligase [Nitrososphaerales archaeon]